MTAREVQHTAGPWVEIVECLGGRFMVLVNGFQWGGTVDRSGAGDATFATAREARQAYFNARGSK